jgi:hypothetical protein
MEAAAREIVAPWALNEFIDADCKSRSLQLARRSVRACRSAPSLRRTVPAFGVTTGRDTQPPAHFAEPPPLESAPVVHLEATAFAAPSQHVRELCAERPGTALVWNEAGVRETGVEALRRRELSTREAQLAAEPAQLMTPNERRVLLQTECDHARSWALLREHNAQRAARVRHWQRRHPNGVAGVDSPANPESRVYADTARATQASARESEARLAARRALATVYTRSAYFARDARQEAPPAPARPRRQDATDSSRLQAILFYRPKGPQLRPRAQRLRDAEQRGRPDNVFGVMIDVVPPTVVA